MTDDYQIIIPPSFLGLYSDARGRLQIPLAELRERYDLCEDLAQQLVDTARNVYLDMGIAEDEVLRRCRAGLINEPATVPEAEADWVVTRLAELLGW